MASYLQEATEVKGEIIRQAEFALAGIPKGQRPFGHRAMFAKQTRLLDEVQLCSGETPPAIRAFGKRKVTAELPLQ